MGSIILKAAFIGLLFSAASVRADDSFFFGIGETPAGQYAESVVGAANLENCDAACADIAKRIGFKQKIVSYRHWALGYLSNFMKVQDSITKLSVETEWIFAGGTGPAIYTDQDHLWMPILISLNADQRKTLADAFLMKFYSAAKQSQKFYLVLSLKKQVLGMRKHIYRAKKPSFVRRP